MSITEAAQRVTELAGQALLDQAQSVGGEVGALMGEMEAMNGQIDTDWQAVSSHVDSLMSTAQDAMSRVQAAGDAMKAKADEVGGSCDEAASEDEASQDSARTMVESLEQGVLALVPDLDSVVSGVEDVFSTMGSELQSEFGSMDEMRSAAEDFLRGDFSSLVNVVGETLSSRCADLGSYIDSDALVTFADEVSNLGSHVDDIVSQATDKLNEVGSMLEEEGSAALSSVQDMFNEKFGGLIETAQTVADLIDRVGQAIAGLSEAVGDATTLLGQGVNLTGIGATSALGIIEDITAIFSEIV